MVFSNMVSGFRLFVLKHSHRIVSRWIILFLDLVLVTFSFFLANLLRHNFEWASMPAEGLQQQALVYLAAFLLSFLLLKPHVGIVRHTTLNDALKVFYACTFALTLLASYSVFTRVLPVDSRLVLSTGVLLIAYLVTLFNLLFLRLSVKVVYHTLARVNRPCERFLIFGAGELGMNTKQIIEGTQQGRLKVEGFIDDNPTKVGKRFSGVMVYPEEVLTNEFLQKKNIVALILAVNDLPVERRLRIVERCLELNLEVRTVPKVEDWVMGQLSFRQIRKVQIEELLARETITVNNGQVAASMHGKTVLVTGAAGSIGSELCQQIVRLGPTRLLMLDNAETPMHNLEQRMNRQKLNGATEMVYLLRDVTQAGAIRYVMGKYRPNIIFHAAAYKHVPLMERNPLEAIRVNIMGTRNVAMLAREFGVKRFVLVSTDKAVNPTSIMGASKRVAELLVQQLQNTSDNNTQFIITRFGNVLGSNGSVIPMFEKQIASGGPVTVTHPDMKRFFMTIPEACELVLEASVMGNGGEIFVFDMGEQQRIVELAVKMIKLSGLMPGVDIDIVFTGLRPGEKLYEELFCHDEQNLSTHHPKIMIAKIADYPFHLLQKRLIRLEHLLETQEPTLVGEMMKKIVPGYATEIVHTPDTLLL